jgi:hypothetical protein
VLAPLLACSRGGTGLAFPSAQAASGDASGGLRRGFGLDAPIAKLLGEGLAPAVQVLLAGVQALAVAPLRANADMDVRVGLMRVQDHDVAMVRQFSHGELACRLAHHASIGAGRHRQHDVEGLATFADLGDACAAESPLIGDRALDLPSLADRTAVRPGARDVGAARRGARAVGIGRWHRPASRIRHRETLFHGTSAGQCAVENQRGRRTGHPGEAFRSSSGFFGRTSRHLYRIVLLRVSRAFMGPGKAP